MAKTGQMVGGAFSEGAFSESFLPLFFPHLLTLTSSFIHSLLPSSLPFPSHLSFLPFLHVLSSSTPASPPCLPLALPLFAFLPLPLPPSSFHPLPLTAFLPCSPHPSLPTCLTPFPSSNPPLLQSSPPLPFLPPSLPLPPSSFHPLPHTAFLPCSPHPSLPTCLTPFPSSIPPLLFLPPSLPLLPSSFHPLPLTAFLPCSPPSLPPCLPYSSSTPSPPCLTPSPSSIPPLLFLPCCPSFLLPPSLQPSILLHPSNPPSSFIPPSLSGCSSYHGKGLGKNKEPHQEVLPHEGKHPGNLPQNTGEWGRLNCEHMHIYVHKSA